MKKRKVPKYQVFKCGAYGKGKVFSKDRVKRELAGQIGTDR
jgi:hypothetical protein